jgi:molybdopterin-dependent oxidoreductase alpha subunit
MAQAAPREDPGDTDLSVSPPKDWAAGLPGVTASLRAGLAQMGVVRTTRTLLKLNQVDGFDCPGCAWPDPAVRKTAEFCENGAKAVAEEATRRRITPEFFAEHSVSELAERSDYWLGQQGRLTTPMFKPEGEDHYRPVSWDEAFGVIAAELTAIDPDRAVFYTSGRTSNEAAFLYQLFARQLGTNNLPDCSNMCHESSGAALSQTLGVGKGSVLLEDLYAADLIIICGQNPGTNHPRMLSALQEAKKHGARIVAVNPLPEAGLLRFKDPQRPSGLVGAGDKLADRFLQIRLNGDLGLFRALGRMLLEADAVDRDFIAGHTAGFDEYAADVRTTPWELVEEATGLTRDELAALADDVRHADKIIVCWAMGLTQHKNAVATIREIVNFLLLGGNVGRPGTGVCPVRGHSNVQGDRTMGIWEKMPGDWMDRLGAEFSFTPPRKHGVDVVDSIRAMRDGRVDVLLAMGGNFLSATPDADATADAVRRLALTAHVSTKLNRSHTVTGRAALILPCLGRTERDQQAGGEQFVTVEDSMGVVHASRGRLKPASPELLSEVSIVSRLARRALGERSTVDWAGLEDDYNRIRDHIARVVPGFDDFNIRVASPGGFVLPHPPRDERRFPTESGKANFTVNELTVVRTPPGRLLLQTIRSHDQYNTTIYGLDDRYRGIHQGRRVVFVHPDDLAERGLTDGAMVDVISEWADGERRAPAFRVVSYPTARGCAAAYFPEANVLVPLDSVAEVSNTPVSKSIIVRLEPHQHVGEPPRADATG